MDQADQEGRPLTAQEIRRFPGLHAKIIRGRQQVEAQIAAVERLGTREPGHEAQLSKLKAQHEQLVLADERMAQIIRTGRTIPQAQLLADTVANPTRPTSLPSLGVYVYDGNVYELKSGRAGSLLGPLAGAQAAAVPSTIGRRRTGGQRVADATLAAAALHSPLGLLAGAHSRPRAGVIAVIAFASGNSWQTTLADPASLARAQAEAMRFNALADAVTQSATAGHDDTGIATQLERLAALHASGALNDDEYQTAKARIISG